MPSDSDQSPSDASHRNHCITRLSSITRNLPPRGKRRLEHALCGDATKLVFEDQNDKYFSRTSSMDILDVVDGESTWRCDLADETIKNAIEVSV